MQKKLALLYFALTLAIFFNGYVQGAEAKPKNVILIGWDGAQRDHLKELLNEGKLPNLKKISLEGTLVDIDVITGATDTKAGWAQILTGYNPNITGVYNNGRFAPIPEGHTVFERLEAYFGDDNFITVAVIGKKQHVDYAASKRKLVTPAIEERLAARGKKIPKNKLTVENGQKYLLIDAEPYHYSYKNIDVFINGLKTNEIVGLKTISYLQEYKDETFFFFVHFAEIDHQGHMFGENSQQYSQALQSCDYWTGKIIESLKQLNLYNKTIIYVTADHGFDEGQRTHNNAPYIFLATNDPKVKHDGDRRDITPTILKTFGLDLNKIQPRLDGQPLN